MSQPSSRPSGRPKNGRRAGGGVSYRLAEAVVRVVAASPRPVRAATAWVLGGLTYLCLGSRRRVAEANIAAAFPDMRPGAVRSLARHSIRNMIFNATELLYCQALTPEQVRARVTVEGLERLEEALAEGRGLIALTGHVGPFTLIAAALAFLGHPCSYVYRYMNARAPNLVLERMCREWGVGLISALPRRRAAFACLAALRRGEIICILGDQHANDGIPVPFFGREALTAPGAAVLAERTGAPILPMFIRATGRSSYVVDVGWRVSPDPTAARDERIRSIVAGATRAVEEAVRRDPAQWFWLHRRWRV